MQSIVNIINIAAIIFTIIVMLFSIIQIRKSKLDLLAYKQRLANRKMIYKDKADSLKNGYGFDNEHN